MQIERKYQEAKARKEREKKEREERIKAENDEKNALMKAAQDDATPDKIPALAMPKEVVKTKKMPNITVVEKVPLSPSEKSTGVDTVDGRLSRLTFESLDSAIADDNSIASNEDNASNLQMMDNVGFKPPSLSRDVSLLTKVFEDDNLDVSLKLRREEHRKKLEEEHKRLWGEDEDHEERQKLIDQKREMKKSTQGNAVSFVKQEERRYKAMTWLCDQGRHAVIECGKDEAYEFLSSLTTDAKVKTAHLTKSLRASSTTLKVYMYVCMYVCMYIHMSVCFLSNDFFVLGPCRMAEGDDKVS